MAKVRVKKGKLWERGDLGLFTPGMEDIIDSSLLEGGSALNDIVEIISLGEKASIKESVEPVVEVKQEKQKAEIIDDTEIIENAETEVIEESVKEPPKSIKDRLLRNVPKKKKK